MNHADLIIYLECDLEKEKEFYNSLQDDINFLIKQSSIHKEGFYAREKLPYYLLEKQEGLKWISGRIAKCDEIICKLKSPMET